MGTPCLLAFLATTELALLTSGISHKEFRYGRPSGANRRITSPKQLDLRDQCLRDYAEPCLACALRVAQPVVRALFWLRSGDEDKAGNMATNDKKAVKKRRKGTKTTGSKQCPVIFIDTRKEVPKQMIDEWTKAKSVASGTVAPESRLPLPQRNQLNTEASFEQKPVKAEVDPKVGLNKSSKKRCCRVRWASVLLGHQSRLGPRDV